MLFMFTIRLASMGKMQSNSIPAEKSTPFFKSLLMKPEKQKPYHKPKPKQSYKLWDHDGVVTK